MRFGVQSTNHIVHIIQRVGIFVYRFTWPTRNLRRLVYNIIFFIYTYIYLNRLSVQHCFVKIRYGICQSVTALLDYFVNATTNVNAGYYTHKTVIIILHYIRPIEQINDDTSSLPLSQRIL